MIARIDGELESVKDGSAYVRVGDIVYELLVPAGDQMRLAASVGERMGFFTLHYLEGQGQGSSYWPRLIGFSSPEDREFFELFTTVKGIGNKKALRALQLAIPVVAEAIANGDAATLRALPEIGKKTADTIVLELKDKVNRFLGARSIVEVKPGDAGRSRIVSDATTVLVQLGENRMHARALVDRAMIADPALDTADAVVTAALSLRAMG
ncbi:MAG: Holliday junction branch migration protein RuvA [Phycisphaerae bacterium]|nr:Holliday junction branch migration protein RuvA [Phycisphaerae bacterium]